MMPQTVPSRRPRRGRRAAAGGAHGGFGGRRDPESVATSLVKAGLHRRVLAVAFEKQSESNAMWALSIAPAVAACGWWEARPGVRAAHPRLHQAQRRAATHRGDGRGRGPAQRRPQPVRPACSTPKASALRTNEGTRSGTTRPALRPTGRARWSSAAPTRSGGPGSAAWIRATAMRSEPTMFAGQGPRQHSSRPGVRRGMWPLARRRRAERDQRGREYVPVLLVRAHVAGERGFAAPGQGWRVTEAGETALWRQLGVNPSGGVLQLQPDRRVRPAPLPRRCRAWARRVRIKWKAPAPRWADGGGSQFFSMWEYQARPR